MKKLMISFLFLLIVCMWGTIWLAMSVAVKSIPPVFLTAIKFTSASALLIFFVKLAKKPLLMPLGQRSYHLLLSFFYTVIPLALILLGKDYVSSWLTAVIFSVPVAVLAASGIILRKNSLYRSLSV